MTEISLNRATWYNTKHSTILNNITRPCLQHNPFDFTWPRYVHSIYYSYQNHHHHHGRAPRTGAQRHVRQVTSNIQHSTLPKPIPATCQWNIKKYFTTAINLRAAAIVRSISDAIFLLPVTRSSSPSPNVHIFWKVDYRNSSLREDNEVSKSNYFSTEALTSGHNCSNRRLATPYLHFQFGANTALETRRAWVIEKNSYDYRTLITVHFACGRSVVYCPKISVSL